MRYIVVLLFSFSVPCAGQTIQHLKSYFFPYHNCFQPQIYKYTNKKNPNDILYWHLQTKINNKEDTIFITTIYDQNFYKLETLTQVITSKGVTLQNYTLQIAGTTTLSKIIHKDVFRWNQSEVDSFKWSARYTSEFGEESIRKKRKLSNNSSNYIFNKQNYNTIFFDDSFRHSIKANKKILTMDFYQTSQYCQTIGLVNYQRKMSNGKAFCYQLEKVIPLQNWEKMKKNQTSDRQPTKRT